MQAEMLQKTPLQLRQPKAAPPSNSPQQSRPTQQSDNWSLGDLLARASVTGDDDGNAPVHRDAETTSQPPARFEAPPPQPPPAQVSQQQQVAQVAPQPAPGLDISALSRALDPATASTIWSRFQAGQRGFMVRSIYAPESRNLFDGIARRYRADESFKALVDRFLSEYENELSQADQRDGTGGNSQQLVQSETGRVYLVLAHASGRLA